MVYFFLGTTVFSMARIVIGPTAADRLIGLNLVGIIIDIVLIYPHAYFTWEMYKGVMTKETYKKEEYLMPGLPPFPEV